MPTFARIVSRACFGLAAAASAVLSAQPARAQSANTSFFVTSNGIGNGANNLTKQTALSEKGDVLNGRGDTPNRHDVLTGSQADGTAFAAGEDRTCKNRTSSTQGSAMVGHFDRLGLRDDDASKSWNSSHPSRGPDGGCSQADLKSTGGDGLLYCFAAN
jgi:hypothetical protein